MLIVGEKEAADQKVAVRRHGKGDEGVFGIKEFANLVSQEIENDFNNKK